MIASSAKAREERATVDVGRCFEAHAEWLLLAMTHLTGSRQCAEEIVQETFRFALEHPDALYDGAGLRSWLYRVARNQSMHRFRSRTRRGRMIERLTHEVVPDAPDPYERLASREQEERVLRCLQHVGPQRRAVLELFELQDVPMGEVASRLGIAPGTVGSRLTRGRAELREVWSTFSTREDR